MFHGGYVVHQFLGFKQLAGNQLRLWGVTTPSQEIVRHAIPIKQQIAVFTLCFLDKM